jgi:long-chain acyl-CoA synthetase
MEMGAQTVRTVADLLSRAAVESPDDVGLVDDSGRWSWRALDERASALAAGLRRAGLAPGDRLAVQLPSGMDFVSCYLGGLRAGLVVVPVNTAYTVAELGHVLRDSGAAMVMSKPPSSIFAPPAWT